MPHSFFSFSRTDFFSGVLVVIWAAEGVLSTFSVFPWFLGLVSLLLLHTQLSLFGSHSANLKTMMVLADVVLSEPALGRSRRSTCFHPIYNKINIGNNFRKIVCSVVAHFLGNKFHTTSPGSNPSFDINFFNLFFLFLKWPIFFFRF